MAKYRDRLPQLGGGFFLTDGGIETTLIFHDGLELPDFAAFHLLKTAEGRGALRKYFRTYAELAKRFGVGLVLESATWRASAHWGERLGYTLEELSEANRQAIDLLEEIRRQYETEQTPVVISGCVGPRGDGYIPGKTISEREAEAYHRRQIEVFAGSAADMVCAITMNSAEEAVGIVRAARRAEMPVAISFTVETDGNLPTGQTLKGAIEQVEEATSGYCGYYMINCAHPTHFERLLEDGGAWWNRIRGIRANASRKSHAELNDSVELDIGDPCELGVQYASLRDRLPHVNVMGGCCGTDHRHVEQIAGACLGRPQLFDERSAVVAKIDGIYREVLDKTEWIAIATTGPEGPHLVATWGDYVRRIGVKGDDEILIPAGGLHKTQENLRHDGRVQVLFATRQVQGSHGAGQGCCVSGNARLESEGPAMDAVKAHFPWARAALVIRVAEITTQL